MLFPLRDPVRTHLEHYFYVPFLFGFLGSISTDYIFELNEININIIARLI